MTAIRCRFDFGRAVCNAFAAVAVSANTAAGPRRTFASDDGAPRSRATPPPQTDDPLDSVKPHARAGVLAAVRQDDRGFPSYLILKETSPMLSQAMIDIKNKKKRKQNSKILLEGKRLIQDALNAGVKPKSIFFSQKRVLEDLCLPENLRDLPVSNTIFYKTPYKMIQLFSETETSQGIMGVFEIPSLNHEVQKHTFPITVVCDNIRDPGNLGSVLRTVAAVGVTQIILMKGCTDLWGSKVLRTGCGAHFRMKIVSDVSWSSLTSLGGQVCLADNNNSDNSDYSNVTTENSVNVFRKTTPFDLPVVPYHEVNYCKTIPLVLVVGGETHGLSDEGYEFARTRKGVRINIPLQNGIESLNSATAIGILCFEARKQMLDLVRTGDEIDKIESIN